MLNIRYTLDFLQIFLSGLIHNVTQISLQATNRRQNVKRLSRPITADEYGRAKVSLLTNLSEQLTKVHLCMKVTYLSVLKPDMVLQIGN